VTVQEGKVVASVWLDSKMVMVMSTNSQPSMGTVLRRKAVRITTAISMSTGHHQLQSVYGGGGSWGPTAGIL